VFRLFHPAAQLLHHQLGAVADAQHRDAHGEEPRVADRRVMVIDAGRPAGENDTRRLQGAQARKIDVVGVDFAVDLLLADPAAMSWVVWNRNPG